MPLRAKSKASRPDYIAGIGSGGLRGETVHGVIEGEK